MSQELTNGMEKETLTQEQIKEQKALARQEAIVRAVAWLDEKKPLGENFDKIVNLAKNWATATNEEKAEMRNAYKESFATKEELKAYSETGVLEDLAVIEDLAQAFGTLKSAYNGIKRYGNVKERISKKDMQVVSIGDKQYQVRIVDIMESQKLPADEKGAFLIKCEHTKEVKMLSFNAL